MILLWSITLSNTQRIQQSIVHLIFCPLILCPTLFWIRDPELINPGKFPETQLWIQLHDVLLLQAIGCCRRLLLQCGVSVCVCGVIVATRRKLYLLHHLPATSDFPPRGFSPSRPSSQPSIHAPAQHLPPSTARGAHNSERGCGNLRVRRRRSCGWV